MADPVTRRGTTARDEARLEAADAALSHDELRHQLRITRRELELTRKVGIEAALPRERWPSIRALALLDESVEAAIIDLRDAWRQAPRRKDPTARRITLIINNLERARTRVARETFSAP